MTARAAMRGKVRSFNEGVAALPAGYPGSTGGFP